MWIFTAENRPWWHLHWCVMSSWSLIRWGCFYDSSGELLDIKVAWQSDKCEDGEIWLKPLCECTWNRKKEGAREQERKSCLMVTQHNKVCGACMTLFIMLTLGYVSAPLWCDSEREHEKEKKTEEGRRGEYEKPNDRQKDAGKTNLNLSTNPLQSVQRE